MKTHEPNKKFFDTLLENGFKTFSLLDMEGNRLVAFATKSNVQPQTKIKEIQQRLHIAPNGIYKLLANFNYSTRTTPEIYYLNKGNVDASYLNEQPTIIQSAPVKKEKESKETNVLSLDSALTRIEELSKLRAENEVLKQRVKDLEIENAELQAELDEAPELSEETQGVDKFGNWMQTIMPTLTPLADEYFKLQNRKLRLEEAKLMTGGKRPQPQKRVVKSQQNMVYPDVNNPQEVEAYFAELDKLSEQDFDSICNFIAQDNPPLYALIEQAYYEEPEQEEEEEEEEEEQQQ